MSLSCNALWCGEEFWWVGLWTIFGLITSYCLYKWYGFTLYLGVKVMFKDIIQRHEDRIIRLQQRLEGEEE